MNLPRTLRHLLHHHRAANPMCRNGLVFQPCPCGAARLVHLDRGAALWSTAWTHDPGERAEALRAYSHEGIATR